jgi:hypothetical protein
MNSRSSFLLAVVVLTLAPAPAHAYIDPSTGILALQGLLAFVGGVLMFLRSPRKWITDLIRRIRSRK